MQDLLTVIQCQRNTVAALSGVDDERRAELGRLADRAEELARSGQREEAEAAYRELRSGVKALGREAVRLTIEKNKQQITMKNDDERSDP